MVACFVGFPLSFVVFAVLESPAFDVAVDVINGVLEPHIRILEIIEEEVGLEISAVGAGAASEIDNGIRAVHKAVDFLFLAYPIQTGEICPVGDPSRKLLAVFRELPAVFDGGLIGGFAIRHDGDDRVIAAGIDAPRFILKDRFAIDDINVRVVLGDEDGEVILHEVLPAEASEIRDGSDDEGGLLIEHGLDFHFVGDVAFLHRGDAVFLDFLIEMVE